jgi:hypothetical protein
MTLYQLYLDNAALKKPIPNRVNSIEFIEVKSRKWNGLGCL